MVIGAERGGALDQSAIDEMVQAADGMDVTLHRVIDVLDDPIAAMDVAIECGFVRILTSGSATSAPTGIAGLTRLHRASAGRIEIMAGTGVTSKNIADIMDQTNIKAFHASCSNMVPFGQRYAALGFGKATRSFDLKEAIQIAAQLAVGRLDQDPCD